MDRTTELILVIGSLLLIGLAMETLAKRIRFPRVTLLLIVGFLVGPSVLNLIPTHIVGHWFPALTKLALSMIGFILGSKITRSSFNHSKKYVLSISLSVVIVTAVFVFTALWIFQAPLEVALLLAGLSAATAPAATTDVIMELNLKDQFSDTLLKIVAIDDAWTLILFSLMMVLVHLFQGHYAHMQSVGLKALWEIFGAILIGLLLGFPAAFLSGRIRPGKPTLLEALGIVFLGCGIALWLHVSFILMMMVVGSIVSNFAKHHLRTFHAIENIEWPFMVLFFILGGSQMRIDALPLIGVAGLVYIIARFFGRIVGGWIGSRIVSSDNRFQRWIGLALMPQAGVAIGLALIATQAYPHFSKEIMMVVLTSTVVFELIGPILTRRALLHAK